MSVNDKRTLYVGGLEESVTEATLRAAFVPFGELSDVNMPLDAASSKHKGFAFVQYDEKEDAAEAMDNMHNSELFGRVLRVNRAPSHPHTHARAVEAPSKAVPAPSPACPFRADAYAVAKPDAIKGGCVAPNACAACRASRASPLRRRTCAALLRSPLACLAATDPYGRAAPTTFSKEPTRTVETEIHPRYDGGHACRTCTCTCTCCNSVRACHLLYLVSVPFVERRFLGGARLARC
jgi:hypothetical protein